MPSGCSPLAAGKSWKGFSCFLHSDHSIRGKCDVRHIPEQPLCSGRQQNILQPAKLNAIHLLPLTSLCCLLQEAFPSISVLAKFSVTHVLPRYSKVVNSPQTSQWFWWSPASVALAGFDKWSYWCEEENRCFALFSSKQWCYFYRMTQQESKILPNLRALTCSSSSVRLSINPLSARKINT